MIKSVQQMRGLAACAVVLLHATMADPAMGIFRIGSAGVDLFFVISGFIMATIAPGRDAGAFLWRRATRIYPMWWVAFALLLPAGLAAGRVDGIVGIVRNVTLIPLDYGKMFPAIGWTLSFEMLFYGAVALALLTRWWVPLGLFAIALGLGHPFFGNALIFEFLMGVVIAKLPHRFGPLFVLAGVILLSSAPTPVAWYEAAIYAEPMWGRVLHWGVPCALIVYGALGCEEWLKRLPSVLGDASYSIYLFHPIAMYAFAGWPLKFAGGVGLGLLAYYLLERPLMRWRKKRLA